MLGSSTDLFWPSLAGFYAAATPWVVALLRVMVGLSLVPHGLRAGFGWFPNTGLRHTPGVSSFAQFAGSMERKGYRPSYLWAALACFTQIVLGPMMALGLFTRPAAAAATALLLLGCIWHIQMGHRWFWNQQGIEYPLMWALAALFFAAYGGGPISLDLFLFGKTF